MFLKCCCKDINGGILDPSLVLDSVPAGKTFVFVFTRVCGLCCIGGGGGGGGGGGDGDILLCNTIWCSSFVFHWILLTVVMVMVVNVVVVVAVMV